MQFAHRIRRAFVAGTTLSLAALAGPGTPLAQTATPPTMLAPPAADAPARKKPPVAAPAAQAAKTAAPKHATAQVPPAPNGAKPAEAKKPPRPATAKAPVDTAALKLAASARRAAMLAALTAQATPPVHNHVSRPSTETCANPDAIGVARVLEVDTTGGLYLGQRYMNGKLPLEPKEVVLTFDDGPVPRNTDRVLAALAAECTKASFFIVGEMAKAHPEALRRVAAAGHTIGYHTMTHPLDMVKRPLEFGKANISTGWKTVDQILYGKAEERPANSFFRYPGLFNSYGINAWLNSLDVGTFAIDAAGNDWLKGYLTASDAPNVMNEALKELERNNGGILLLHDIKESSSRAVAPLLRELKARGFRIVHVVPKRPPPPLVDHLATGSVEPAQPLPAAERSPAGFDASQNLVQEPRGFASRPAATALPAGTAAAPEPATLHQAAHIVPAPAPVAAPAAAATPTRERSIADMIGGDDAPAPHAEAAAPDASWLATTGRSFRGIAAAIGIW
jgi:peptidoglycan/xylan/chitin deacetylase (PgdA/CDA1 family)